MFQSILRECKKTQKGARTLEGSEKVPKDDGGDDECRARRGLVAVAAYVKWRTQPHR